MSTTKVVKSVNVYKKIKISLKSIRATLYFLVKIIGQIYCEGYCNWILSYHFIFSATGTIHVVDNLTVHFAMFSKLFVWGMYMCIWTSWMTCDPVFLKKSYVCNAILLLFPLEKGTSPFEQNWTPSDQGCFMPSLVKIGRADPDRKKESCQFWHLLSTAWSFIEKKLNFFHPKMF